jgi:hypothetical protein
MAKMKAKKTPAKNIEIPVSPAGGGSVYLHVPHPAFRGLRVTSVVLLKHKAARKLADEILAELDKCF